MDVVCNAQHMQTLHSTASAVQLSLFLLVLHYLLVLFIALYKPASVFLFYYEQMIWE